MDTFMTLSAVLAATIFPLVLLRIGLAAYSTMAPPDADAVPLLHVGGIGIGALLGMGLLAAMPHGADFAPETVLAIDGPWAVGVLGLLARHALPDALTLEAAGAALRQGSPGAAAALLRLSLALMLVLMVQAAWLWRGWQRPRAALAVLLLVCWTGLLLYHLAHLLAWSVAQMNFWAFAVALLLWQRWRHGTPRAAH